MRAFFFIKNILFVIAVNVLVKPIWVFFIDRTVQNTVATGSYGTYAALLNLSIIFQTVLDFGISSYNSRTIAQNPDKLPELFPAMLSARLLLGNYLYDTCIYMGVYIWLQRLGIEPIDRCTAYSVAQCISIIYKKQCSCFA